MCIILMTLIYSTLHPRHPQVSNVLKTGQQIVNVFIEKQYDQEELHT
jgi:hypothetical protein